MLCDHSYLVRACSSRHLDCAHGIKICHTFSALIRMMRTHCHKLGSRHTRYNTAHYKVCIIHYIQRVVLGSSSSR